jgi:hypothetical protein
MGHPRQGTGEWQARLVGGPFNGESGGIEELPPRLWVIFCPACGSHWYGEGPTGEVYTLHEIAEDSTATYKYEGDPAPGEDTDTDTDLPSPKERELQPA